MRFPYVVLLSACALMLALPLLAQSPNGVLNGLVVDPSNRAIVGADILAANDVTGVKYTTKTNEEGIYVLPNLPPGPYRLQVAKTGFKTLIKPDIVLNVQDALSINFTLPIGAVFESMTVEGGAPLVNTESAAVSTVVDRQFAENLPMNGRSFQTLIELTPGVVLTSANNNDQGQFSVNGQRANSNYFMIDGVSANTAMSGFGAGGLGQTGGASLPGLSVLGSTNTLVSVDAMQEFRIQTSTYAPEFGRTPGAQISIATRSGTNRFHGTAFEYLRNDLFDANDWFSNFAGLPKSAERINDFGGVLGGPIAKSKTFFFFSYEGQRLRLPQTGITTVPSLSARQSAPLDIQPYLNAFGVPNGADVGNGQAQFNAGFSDRSTLNATSIRIDHSLSSTHTVFGRYSYLTFNYRPTRIPNGWQSNMVYRWFSQGGIPVDALALYDVRRNQARIVFDAPDAGFEQPTMWSRDSRSFTLVSLSPVGTSWEREDAEGGFKDALQLESYTHLFALEVESSRISKILHALPAWSQNPTLFWQASTSRLLLRKSSQSFAWMKRKGDAWVEESQFTPSLGDFSLRPSASSAGSTVASNGEVVVGIRETLMSPPEILKYEVKSGHAALLTELNPEYRDITLGEIETVRWKNSFGADCSGLLVKPVGYAPGQKYPFVVMAKGWSDGFVSDTRFQTAFPPQPLANAGFLVLMANMPAGGSQSETYPSALGETSNWMSMVEGGITLLSDRGMIDAKNVGIIGFSRTSWLLDFMITHSSFPFAAASSADSGLYNYGTYWYDNSKDAMKGAEQEMGGPPYGVEFKNWSSYSPAFNAQNTRVPLLMEYSGYGVLSQPVNALEFFVALNRQAKPVELYFYPLGEHMLDTPFERVASLQRNVDWFRFWMQNYERSKPDDPDQYARWHALRDLHVQNEGKRSDPRNP